MSHCYLPRWVEDSESSKTRGSPPNQVDCQPLIHSVQLIKTRTAQSPEVSPSRVHRIMARLLILLCCIPPPPTFSSLHRDDCQLCLCPCSTAFCSALCCCKWNTEEGGILIRWLATVSLRRSTYCVCVRACVCAISVGRSGFLCSWNRTCFYIKVWINLDYHLMNIRASNCILLRIRRGY